MDGVGLRTYAKGSCYHGQWRNGLRHGRGTMVWTYGNVYRGEWKCGSMHGYGEYVWNGFFNKTLTWPREASYVGHWRNGMRHGEGELKLNAVGGAKYSGFWMDNKKHGYGIIIGSNGEKFESNPLFLNDVLCSGNIENINLNNDSEDKTEVKCIRVIKEIKPEFVEKPNELNQAPELPVLKPEQYPSLFYHITRLLNPESLEERPLPEPLPDKCYTCENESCTCLAANSEDTKKEDENGKEGTDTSKTETGKSDPSINNEMESNYKYEEQWTYNCLTLHMTRLREIYNQYARLFTKSAPKCNLALSRICLWQLWRDCGIHKKGLSLIDIDNYMAKNKSTVVKDPYHPFEKIEIWQFIHALLEVSWQLYTKFDDVETEEINGKLAGGLLKLLKNDIYPHAGNHVGNVHQKYKDLLPIDAVFQLYKQIGYPFSAKDLLRTLCALNDLQAVTTEAIKNLPNGANCVTICEKVNYLLKLDDILMQPRCTVETSEDNESDSAYGLLVFKELGTLKLLEIMVLICPAIKDVETDAIVNMEYEFTFLEFYEIIMETTKQLLSMRKNLQKKEIEEEDTLSQNNDSQKKESFAKNRRSLLRKSSRVKNKT
nr:PREDICTED: radial spoke head 10 homolog B-like [Megachile rotundata]